MQIHIDTATDDLPAVIRMLQAYGGYQATVGLVADVKELSAKVESAARSMGIVKSGPDHKIEGGGGGAALANFVARVNDPTSPCLAHADKQGEEPTPEQVFAAPKSLFDAPQPNAPDDPVQPPPHSDAPLPPCDQTEKVGEATGAPRTAINDVTVDAAGLPWDARIHSGAKTKLANGNWKLLRGVDPALVKTVEAELRGGPKPPAAPGATTPASVGPVAAPVPNAAAAVSPPSPPTQVADASAPRPPPAPPVPPAPKPITNAAELVAAVMDKRFTTDQVNAACQAVDVENVASLLAKQDKLPLVLKELGV